MSESSPSYWETVLDKPHNHPSATRVPPPQRDDTKNIVGEGARPRLVNLMDTTKLHQCGACRSSFRHISSKYRHYRTVHRKWRELACTECTQHFTERYALQKHYRTVHTGSRPFICDRCGFRFHFKLHLAQHITTVHDNLRPYHCSECNSSFGQRSSLNRHVRHLHPKHANKASPVNSKK